MVDEVIKSKEQLLAEMKKATDAGDWKAVSRISSEIAKSVAAEEKTERDTKIAALEGIRLEVKKAIDKAVQPFIMSKDKDTPVPLEFADGIWYAYDFGTTTSELKVTKGAARKAAGTGSSNGGYVAGLPSNAEMLAQVGSHIMFAADTDVTIDKVVHTMPAGTTFQQAQDYSKNGGWRNRVRMALGKETGRV